MRPRNPVFATVVVAAMLWMTIAPATAQPVDGPSQGLIIRFKELEATATPFAVPCDGCGAGIVNPLAALTPPAGLQADAGRDRFFLTGPYSFGMIDACGSTGNIASYTFQQLSYQSSSNPGATSSVKRLATMQPELTAVDEQALSTPYISARKCRILVKGFAAGDVLTIRVTVRDAAGNASSDDVVLRGVAASSKEYLEAEQEFQAVAKAGNFL